MPLFLQNFLNHFNWIDASCLIFLPALALSVWAAIRIKRIYRRYKYIESRHEMIGSKVVKELLKAEGVKQIKINNIPGVLTDHYNNELKTIGLSNDVYYGDTIMALGIAAHEAGHAVQYARHPKGIHFRNLMLIPVNITANLSIPFIVLGLIFSFELVGKIGIYAFFFTVAFHLLTLPLEIQAGNIALELLEKKKLFEPEEKESLKRVLNSAALTYIAYAPMAFIHLLRLIGSSGHNPENVS